MRLIVIPGVLNPPSDADLLVDTMYELGVAEGADVLDVFTGSGVLALGAAAAGARNVTAIDIARRACLNARLNSRLHRARVRVLRGDMFEAVAGERFDLIVANPPYVPGGCDEAPRGVARAWEGGSDGRALVDPFCARVARHLRPGGSLLLVHSSLTGESATTAALTAAGLDVRVAARARGGFGPIVAARQPELEAAGHLRAGEQTEELIVFHAMNPESRPDNVSAVMADGGRRDR